MSDNAVALAFAALWSSINNLRLMAEKGLVSPADVDVSQALILEALEQLGDRQQVEIYHPRIENMMQAIRSQAAHHSS